MIVRVCEQCDKDFKTHNSEVRKGGARFCSRKCVFASWKMFPRKRTEEQRKKCAESKWGERNPRWSDQPFKSYSSRHLWVRRRLKQPECCPNCGEKKKVLDLANISQEYKRDLDDWEFLCRRCHMVKDGRLERFKKTSKQGSFIKN